MFSNTTNAIISYFIHVMKYSTMLYATPGKHHFSKTFSKAHYSVSVCIFSTKALYVISVIRKTPIFRVIFSANEFSTKSIKKIFAYIFKFAHIVI